MVTGKKISELIELTELTGNEFIPIQVGVLNMKIKTDKIALKSDLNNNIPIINHGTSDAVFALIPNEYHVWGEMTELTITLTTPTDANIINEYMFQFTSGTQATKLTIPQEIKWIGGTPKIEASKTYQVSIVNGIGVLGGV